MCFCFKSTKFVDISEDDNFDFKIVGEVSHFYLKEALTRFFLFSLPLTLYFPFTIFFPAEKEDASIQIKFNVFTNKFRFDNYTEFFAHTKCGAKQYFSQGANF